MRKTISELIFIIILGGGLGLERREKMATMHMVYFEVFLWWLAGPACESSRALQL